MFLVVYQFINKQALFYIIINNFYLNLERYDLQYTIISIKHKILLKKEQTIINI